MTPREADPIGANSGSGSAGYEDATSRTDPERATRDDVDETERDVITSGTAATSEVADRDAQDDASGQGDGPPEHR